MWSVNADLVGIEHAEHQFPISRIAWLIPKKCEWPETMLSDTWNFGKPNKPPMQSAQIFPCTIQDQLSIQKLVELLFRPRVEAAANLRAGSCYQACIFVGGVEDKVDQTCWGLEDDVNIRMTYLEDTGSPTWTRWGKRLPTQSQAIQVTLYVLLCNSG